MHFIIPTAYHKGRPAASQVQVLQREDTFSSSIQVTASESRLPVIDAPYGAFQRPHRELLVEVHRELLVEVHRL